MKTFSKSYIFNASIDEVFKALTDHDEIEKWSGGIAIMDLKPGGKFSLWDDSINGRNILISKNQIIQDWKDETWDKYSKVTFNLIEIEDEVTQVDLIHEGIPPGALSSVRDGWEDAFMNPLKELLEEGEI